ncbi:unnamed protein product [Hapterophycus canaliculatus]
MAKFYIQSGNFRRVVAADSTRKAAVWAVHEVMQQIIPTDEPSEQPRPQQEHQDAQPVVVLSGKLRVDERGFDRFDAKEIPTVEVVAEWTQMVMTLDRLQQMFGTPDETSVIHSPNQDDRFGDDYFADDMAA